jgi:hypothetical protein
VIPRKIQDLVGYSLPRLAESLLQLPDLPAVLLARPWRELLSA